MSGGQITRKKIRVNLVALLTSFTDAGTNVFRNRAVPMFSEELSCINIYTRDDVSMLNKRFDWNFDRDVQVFIEILVKKNGESHIPEDDADVIAGQVEDRILPNQLLQYPPPDNIQVGGAGTEGDPGDEIIDSIQLFQVSEEKTPEGLTDVFGLVMEFKATYNYEVLQGNIDPFVTADVRYNIAGEQAEADETHDRITLPQ